MVFVTTIKITPVSHIEDLELHFLEDDLSDSNDDGDSAIKWFLFNVVVEVFTCSA